MSCVRGITALSHVELSIAKLRPTLAPLHVCIVPLFLAFSTASLRNVEMRRSFRVYFQQWAVAYYLNYNRAGGLGNSKKR